MAMHQLWIIVIKEIKIAIREKLVLILASTIVMLIAVALYAGYLSYQQQRSIIVKTKAEKRQEWLNQGDKHPHIAAHYGTFVFKPKTALSSFDFGLDAYNGTSIYLEAHYQHEFMFRPAQDHSSMIRFGELSSALVLKVLVPLLIIFLTFTSYTQERESGTLKLLVSQGIALSRITWGKILAYCSIMTVILSPFFLGMLLLSTISVQQESIPDMTTRATLMILLYGVYLFLFIAFSVWVSQRSSSGRNALLTLLSCWMLLVILMPKTVANLSESFYSLPSMREFKATIEKDKIDGIDGKQPRSEYLAKLRKQYLEKYEVDSVQQLPFNYEGVSMQAGEEYGNTIYDHHMDKLQKIFESQNQLVSISSMFNPFLSVQNLSMALAGTDMYTFKHFEDVVEKYRRELVRRMNRDMAENSKYGDFYGYEAGIDLWQEIEDFSYRTPTAQEVLRNYRVELTSLLLWMSLIIWLIIGFKGNIKPIDG